MNEQNVQVPPKAVDPRLGPAIRQLREKRGWSQEDFAVKADLTLSTINQVELKKSNPTWTTVVALAKGLGVTVTELAEAVEAEH